MNKQLNRMRIMNGLPPKKEKVVEAKVAEQKPFDPGYLWYSYGDRIVKVLQRPVALDPETFKPSKGILTRYGKKLLAEGAKYYSTVKVSDFRQEPEARTSIGLKPETLSR